MLRTMMLQRQQRRLNKKTMRNPSTMMIVVSASVLMFLTTTSVVSAQESAVVVQTLPKHLNAVDTVPNNEINERMHRDATDTIVTEEAPEQRRELFWSMMFLSTCFTVV
jgi:predicted PurR-regulated permease PerM